MRRLADHMVTLGKTGTLAARRRAAAVVRGDPPLRKLFTDLAARYADRVGGYTRVLATRRRVGDAAPMAFLEFVARPGELRPAAPPTAAATADARWAAARRALWTRGGVLAAAAAARGAEAAAAAAAAATAPEAAAAPQAAPRAAG